MDVFFALFLSILLWMACACWGKLFCPKFSPALLHHLLCLAVFLVSLVCLVTVFKLNKANNYLKKVQLTVQTVIDDSAEIEKLKHEYPVLSTFIDMKNTNIVIRKIKSYRNRALFTFVFFQLIAFGVMTYSASKHAKRTAFSTCHLNGNDYMYSG